jgi:hypothetical protein
MMCVVPLRSLAASGGLMGLLGSVPVTIQVFMSGWCFGGGRIPTCGRWICILCCLHALDIEFCGSAVAAERVFNA